MHYIISLFIPLSVAQKFDELRMFMVLFSQKGAYMGVRFPLEQDRPNITEVVESSAIRRAPAGKEAEENAAPSVRSGPVIRPSNDKDALPQAPDSAHSEEASQTNPILGDTGKQLDILA